MGLHHRSLRQLASAHLVVAHDRHSIVRIKCGCTSHRQCAFPHRERAPSFFAAGSRDARTLAKRDGSSAVCVASIACRIGGLDRRTQRRAQHIFSVAIPWGLREVRGVEPAKAPVVIIAVLCRWIDGQANAGDATVHFPLAGLVAAQARLSPISPPGYREAAVLLAHCGVERCDLCGATKCWSGCSSGKRPLRYRFENALLAYNRYLQKTFLARRFGHLLSDFKNLFLLANRSRPGAVNRNLNCGLFLVRSPALAWGRLVLVFRDAGARDWSRSGGHSMKRRRTLRKCCESSRISLTLTSVWA